MALSRAPISVCVLSLALLTGLASCGSDAPAAQPAGTTAAAPDATTTAGTGVAAPTSIDASAPSTDGGSCEVTVTGDVTANWTSGGGTAAVGYGPWFAGGGLDDTFFILSCIGPGESIISFGANVDSRIPMAPAVYTLSVGSNILGGTDQPDPIHSQVSIDGTDTNWGVREPGTFTIIEFDDAHISGTFDIPVHDSLAKIVDPNAVGKGNATVTGTFNYTKP